MAKNKRPFVPKVYDILYNGPVDFELLRSLPDICSYCQRQFTDKNPRTLDHIVPRSSCSRVAPGVSVNHFSNLLICCFKCNQTKRSMTLDQFKVFISNGNTAKHLDYNGNMVFNVLNAVEILQNRSPMIPKIGNYWSK